MVLLSFNDLKTWTGATHKSKVVDLLNKQGVKFMRDKNGNPITTLSEIEKTLHSKDKNEDWREPTINM